MNKVKFRYVITQEGNFRHGLGGIYAQLETAKEQARRACVAEKDDYHAWAVLAVPYNVPYGPPKVGQHGEVDPIERGLEREVGRWTRKDAVHYEYDTAKGGNKFGRYMGRTPGEPVWTEKPVN